MGFFQKIKDFGSKIVRGVKKGWEWLRDKAAPVVRKVLPVARTIGTAIGGAIGGPAGMAGVNKVADVVDKGLQYIGR